VSIVNGRLSTNETVLETNITHGKGAEQECLTFNRKYFILMESGYFRIVGSDTLEIKIAYVQLIYDYFV
jgi:hypothetical protein